MYKNTMSIIIIQLLHNPFHAEYKLIIDILRHIDLDGDSVATFQCSDIIALYHTGSHILLGRNFPAKPDMSISVVITRIIIMLKTIRN